MKKSGKTSAGKQRWKCVDCNRTTTCQRPDLVQIAQAKSFIDWLLESRTQNASAVSARTFRRQVAWCWQVKVPKPLVTGEVYDQVLVDGIYLPFNWCLITATNGKKIVDWQWCAHENASAYQALMSRLPAPQVAVTDGGAGVAKALRLAWPDSLVQRCLFHVRANTITDLTRRPKIDAGKALLELANQLVAVDTSVKAARWLSLLQAWHGLYGALVNEKSYSTDAYGRRQWWWTHERLRRAYKRLERLARAGHLFTWLNPQFVGLDIQRTTSRLEGGVNAAIRRLLNAHRGMSEAHMKTGVEWLLNQNSIDPADPLAWLNGHRHDTNGPKPKPSALEHIGPASYDTAIDYDTAYQDGSLHIRKGWARR